MRSSIALGVLTVSLATGFASSSAHGGVVGTRAELLAIPGLTFQTEAFEALNIPETTNTSIGTHLDYNTDVWSQGTGKVLPELTFDSSHGGLVWCGQGGRALAAISDEFVHVLVTIDFQTPVAAAGLDLRGIVYDQNENVTLTIYGPDRVTPLDSPSPLILPLTLATPSPAELFYGFSDAGGIGRITLTETDTRWGFRMDNLSFAAVPEPVSLSPLLLAAGGIMRRRR